MKIFKKLFTDIFKTLPFPEYNDIIIEEIYPMFADAYNNPNINMYSICDKINDKLFQCRQIGTWGDVYKERYYRNILTQNGISLKINKKGKLINNDDSFEKDGFVKGNIYVFKNLGYIGNIEEEIETYAVCDQYVLFKEGNNISARRLDNLKLMNVELI